MGWGGLGAPRAAAPMEQTKANGDFGEGGGLILPSRRDWRAAASFCPPACPAELLPGGEEARDSALLQGWPWDCVAG